MDYNIICIDPSLTCTAVVVNDKKAVFVKEGNAKTKTGKLSGWFEKTMPYADYYFHDLPGDADYHVLEVQKLACYDDITNSIMAYVLTNIDTTKDSKVFIEGYSFSSAAGPLIDLVTFGSFLRRKLYVGVTHNIRIIAPTELKALAAKFTYPPIQKGKKVEYRNREGAAGGSFKKHDMYKALIENDALQCEWVQMLREHWSDIMGQKSVPKPIEDLNDAKLMYELAKADKYL